MNRSTTILALAGAAALAIVPAAGAVAAPSGAAAHQAKVTHLLVSKQHFSNAGGQVKFTVKTQHAKRCKITFSAGSPATSSSHVVGCASGTHFSAYVPANDDSAVAKYKVSVVALRHGAFRASHAKSVVITVAKGQPTPPPPVIGGGGTPPPPPGDGELPPPPPGA